MPKPRLLGIAYATHAAPVKQRWEAAARSSSADARADAQAKLKSLRTLEARAIANPLSAGDPVAHDRWPAGLARDYGADIPCLFRFELANRWRGYYTLVGEPGGVRVWILYLWDHETYSDESGYAKK